MENTDPAIEAPNPTGTNKCHLQVQQSDKNLRITVLKVLLVLYFSIFVDI